MRVVVTERAENDVVEHIAYIAARDPDAARQMRQRIIGALGQLQDNPEIGRPGTAPGTRELIISGTRYLAVYVVTTKQVTVLQMWDGRQDWQRDPVQG